VQVNKESTLVLDSQQLLQHKSVYFHTYLVAY